jgi:hypothetical protein
MIITILFFSCAITCFFLGLSCCKSASSADVLMAEWLAKRQPTDLPGPPCVDPAGSSINHTQQTPVSAGH